MTEQEVDMPRQDEPETEAQQPERNVFTDAPAAAGPTYSQNEIAQNAGALGVMSWDVAGIFRDTGKTEMTEAEFRAGLARWRGQDEGETH